MELPRHKDRTVNESATYSIANPDDGAGAPGRRNLTVADLKSVRIGDFMILNASVGVLSLTDWGLGRMEMC